MRRGVKYLLLVVLFVSVLAVGPVFSAAETNVTPTETSFVLADDHNIRLKISIDEAYYTDYDNDSNEDDVFTKYRILVTPSEEDDYWVEKEIDIWVYTVLTLPSGLRFTYRFDLSTSCGVEITQAWINCAIEKGWYRFSIYADGYDYDVKGDYESVVFDPPGIPGGPPAVELFVVQLIELTI